ncbi:MAG TPA: hypothetical protein VMV44_04060 [Rectinemataceae bacterium]|nr:hypothetical protein [Rectinemataceae bacterium]
MTIEYGKQSRVFLFVTGLIGQAYARHVLRLDRVAIEGRERLVEEYRRASTDEGRFVIAYRHPGDSDPHLVFHALTDLLLGEAPAMAEDGRPGAWYPSGTEVQLWASPLVLWALRNAGIVPVKHGGVDRAAIDFLVEGVAVRRRPMAIAPEGMATFHQDLVPDLDPGTARIALLAAERLAREGKGTRVRILPLAIDYSYSRATSLKRLGGFLSSLEARVGLEPRKGVPERPSSTTGDGSAEGEGHREEVGRLLAIWERILTAAETGYARTWGIGLAEKGSDLRFRTIALAEASVARLEAYYGVVPAQTLKGRILNIRAESLRRVFYEKKELKAFSSLEAGMARRGAAEAYFLDQVYLVATLAQFLDPSYIEDGDFDHLVETAQNLYDLANRLEGGSMGRRSRYFRKDARLIVGEPIEVGRKTGEGRREAALRVQTELHDAFVRLIGR